MSRVIFVKKKRQPGRPFKADHGWLRRTVLAAYALGRREFLPPDLGILSVGLVEAVHRMVWLGWAESVAKPGCKWTYRMTEIGLQEAERMLFGRPPSANPWGSLPGNKKAQSQGPTGRGKKHRAMQRGD